MQAVVGYGGERLDRIAKRLLQTERNGAVEALLAANPGLSAAAVNGIVPEGTIIIAPPDFDPAPAVNQVLAWE
ncbi:phage tail protein [Metarhizobium album]|uniref:Phage tail protein n=1 Tax=Metarhizobium album TaxID=2182425 RepID=A0A2U2DG09_9HYPH|nr:tail protein X [Rhizobium album]PWE52257.1 phage tail protein [Rhizobium album]